MSDAIMKGEELYAALAANDIDALFRLLSPDFRGELSIGLPCHLGRVYQGLDVMMGEAWGAVDALLDISPKIDNLYEADDALIARGYYEGTVRASAAPFRAAFAHFWAFNGQQFTSVHQITDSALWQKALT